MFEITDFTAATRWEKESEKFKSEFYSATEEDLKENALVLKSLLNISQETPNFRIQNYSKQVENDFEITKNEISLSYFPFSNAQEFIDYFMLKINLISFNSPKFTTFKCLKSTEYSISMDHCQLKLYSKSFSNHENNLELNYSTIASGNSIGIHKIQIIFVKNIHIYAKTGDISRIFKIWEANDILGLGFVDRKDLRSALKGILGANRNRSTSTNQILKIKDAPCFPKDSLLWVFSERVLDAASVKSKFLSHDTPLVPFIRGLWADFKYLVKNVCIPEGLFLPGLESSSDEIWKVDYRYCLLHQKLSLLNICIHQSMQRSDKPVKYTHILEHPFVKDTVQDELQSPIEKTIKMSKKLMNVLTDNTESKGLDDLLGALTDESWSLVKNDVLFEASPDEDASKRSSWVLAGSPDGRSCKTDWKSLATGEPIWIPVTQDPVQLTEDDLMSLQNQLVELGTSKEGARLRAKLQCENLRSDMQAFKAANPGCVLADFVRWHSPKDWIENSESGSLSARMLEPGNLWEEIWNSAEPIAALHQKPLFDFAQTMDEIVEYLESINVQDILNWTIPTILYMHFTKLTTDDIFSCFAHVQNLADCFAAEWARLDWKSIK